LKSLAHGQLYIESNYLDREASVMPRDRLHRLYPNHVVKIFDLRQAFDQMCFWVTHQSRAQRDGFNFMEPQAFISQMRSLCLVRCSFSSGWNSSRFPSFKDAPCTVEFYVNRALRLLDELLRNPRKARFYLRNGRLPAEKSTADSNQLQFEDEEVPSSSTKITFSKQLDPFMTTSSKEKIESFPNKPGLELSTEKGLSTKPGLELSTNMDYPSKAKQLDTIPFGKMVDSIPISHASEAS